MDWTLDSIMDSIIGLERTDINEKQNSKRQGEKVGIKHQEVQYTGPTYILREKLSNGLYTELFLCYYPVYLVSLLFGVLLYLCLITFATFFF